jgi:hypothetical protein
MKLYFYILLLGAIFSSLSPPTIRACSIPVYQYALERWSADPYEVFIFHHGTLSSEEQAKIDKLQKAKLSANVIVRTVDLADSPNKAMQEMWESQAKSELPLIVVKYPMFSKIPENVWTGGLKSVNIEALLDSPARKEITRRILNDEVAVWAFLESGNKQQDKEKLNVLEAQLKKVSETLKIMVLGDSGQPEAIDREVKFSILKLSRNDPHESFFIQMLLNSEPDLKTLSKPMAFPIYGRGRVLYALVGDGINADNIQTACGFLAGWCSCEIKELNPGVDVLMSVNDSQYEETKADIAISESATTIGGNSDTPKSEPPKVANTDKNRTKLNREMQRITTTSRSVTAPKASNESSNLIRNTLIAVLGLVFGVTAVTSVMLWRKKRA